MAVTPGQVVPLIVRVAAPEGTPYGARIAGTVTATMAYTGASPALVSDSTVQELTLVTTDHAGALVLRKSANKATVLPGATIVYAITFTNGGDMPVGDIVIRDSTPSHTTFVSAAVTFAARRTRHAGGHRARGGRRGAAGLELPRPAGARRFGGRLVHGEGRPVSLPFRA